MINFIPEPVTVHGWDRSCGIISVLCHFEYEFTSQSSSSDKVFLCKHCLYVHIEYSRRQNECKGRRAAKRSCYPRFSLHLFRNQTAAARTFTSGVFVNTESLLKGFSFPVQKGLPRTLRGGVTVLFSFVCHGIIAKAH